MIIRIAAEADVEQIVELFHTTIHTINARDYSAEQLNAWSPARPEPARWRERLAERVTFVADDDGLIAGFGELLPDGRIDCFYCRHTHQRRGVGTRILKAIERQAQADGLGRLTAEASLTARHFLEARGFSVVRPQRVERFGVWLPNFLMEKRLSEPAG